MKIRMISPIRNFNSDVEEFPLTKNLKIIKGDLLRTKIQLSKKFKDQVGSINWQLITHHHIFYFFGEASELVELKSNDRLTVLKTISGKLGDFFYEYIDSLWFIKDNCCFCNQYFLELITDGQVCIIYKDVVTSTATDTFSYFTFNQEELFKHHETFFRIKLPQTAQALQHQSEIDQIFSADGGIIASPVNKVMYDLPRFHRALFFLNMARKNGSAITKVTFFMMLLESLFTSNDYAIAKTIKERGAAIIGGTKKAKQPFKELIFKAYDIRSRNVHGDTIRLEPEKLMGIVTDLDRYVRDILLKVIDSEHSEFFLANENEESKLAFNTYFDGLVTRAVNADLLEEPSAFVHPCKISIVVPK